MTKSGPNDELSARHTDNAELEFSNIYSVVARYIFALSRVDTTSEISMTFGLPGTLANEQGGTCRTIRDNKKTQPISEAR